MAKSHSFYWPLLVAEIAASMATLEKATARTSSAFQEFAVALQGFTVVEQGRKNDPCEGMVFG